MTGCLLNAGQAATYGDVGRLLTSRQGFHIHSYPCVRLLVLKKNALWQETTWRHIAARPLQTPCRNYSFPTRWNDIRLSVTCKYDDAGGSDASSHKAASPDKAASHEWMTPSQSVSVFSKLRCIGTIQCCQFGLPEPVINLAMDQGEDVERGYRRDLSILAPFSESCHVFDSQWCFTSSARHCISGWWER